MSRVFNFSPGPSMLPEAVLAKAAEEMLDYEGSGQSVMEMSHRSKEYDAIIKSCEALLREVMAIPDDYKVLFLQGGASSQFAMVPMNLMTGSGKADFVVTGQWAKRPIRKQHVMVRQMWLLRVRIKLSLIFQNLIRQHLRKMLTIFISVGITPFTEPVLMKFRRLATFRLLLI